MPSLNVRQQQVILPGVEGKMGIEQMGIIPICPAGQMGIIPICPGTNGNHPGQMGIGLYSHFSTLKTCLKLVFTTKWSNIMNINKLQLPNGAPCSLKTQIEQKSQHFSTKIKAIDCWCKCLQPFLYSYPLLDVDKWKNDLNLIFKYTRCFSQMVTLTSGHWPPGKNFCQEEKNISVFKSLVLQI